MARTVQDVVDRVQEILQDETGERYPVHQLVAYVNDAVLEARSIRPDLFIAAFGTPIEDIEDPTDPFPLPLQFFPAVTYYVAGRAELRDDEFAVDGRAMSLMNGLRQKLISGA